MRKLIFAIYLSMCLAAAASVMTPGSRLRLKEQCAPASRDSEDATSKYVPLMLLVSADSALQRLSDLGVIVYNRRDDILLTSVPREHLDSVLGLECLISAETAGRMSACLNEARPMGRADVAQAMESSAGVPFDGAGVITAFSDIGFDSEHIAFRDRVKAVYQYDAKEGLAIAAETPRELQRWHTDDPTRWHATHVANIMAGGYLKSPYYGVATGADIVAATSQLSDVGILAGVEDIIDYARRQGKPLVINLSLGNPLGPHDGTSLFCQYISRCAQEAVICLSAGNTGTSRGYAYKYLDSTDDITRFALLDSYAWVGYDLKGMTEVWSASSTPFDYRVEVVDRDTRKIVYTSPWHSERLAQEPDDASDGSMVLDDDTELWRDYFSGLIELESGVSVLNDRFSLAFAYNLHTSAPSAENERINRYTLSIALRAAGPDAPTLVDIFTDSSRTRLGDVMDSAHSPVFSVDGSISDLCTAEGVIAVGSCNSRNTAPALYSGTHTWNFAVDAVSNFSSCSDRPNMPRLPHFCAPGNYVVSAISSYFVSQSKDKYDGLAAVSLADGQYYYWSAECGTSMASPYAAGVIALWLQADPSLDSRQIIEIAQASARRDFSDIADVRWGAGCIDAAAGLEMVLARQSSLPAQVAHDDGPRRVYSLSGYEVDASRPLPPGVYIVRGGGETARKVVVR